MSMLTGRVTQRLISLLHLNPQLAPPLSTWQARRDKRHKAWDRAMEEGFVQGPAPIVRAGAPVLRRPAREVGPEMLGSAELRALVEQMIETMRAAPGVGLAAPQIGVDLQVIVLEDREEYIKSISPEVAAAQLREPFEPLVVINPRLRALRSEGVRYFEGCLSVPGYQALVERYAAVEVDGLTPEGAPLRLEASGWKARILQHEVDHLRGTLYVDRMLSRSFSTRGPKEPLPEGVPAPGQCTCSHKIDAAASETCMAVP